MKVIITILLVISMHYTFGQSNGLDVGTLNEKLAPDHTDQFAFMIGEFDRIDSVRNRDGQWDVFKNGFWNARYILNGMGIQDESWSPGRGISTTNVRVYDKNSDTWKVTWFKMPGYATTSAEGYKEGDKMVMRDTLNSPQGKYIQEYIFYNITEDSYKWVGQRRVLDQVFPFWKISCKRKIDE